MGKQVKVKFLGRCGYSSCVTKDLTMGKVYDAYVPDAGEVDKDGFPVQYGQREYWIKDDVGDAIVVDGKYGFELVEEAV